jgi:hypothetical protein
MRMQHVITQKDLTSVHVILDSVVMDLHAMVSNACRIFSILSSSQRAVPGRKPGARVLIQPGYLHPEKGKN